jgi:hypothetical protein
MSQKILNINGKNILVFVLNYINYSIIVNDKFILFILRIIDNNFHNIFFDDNKRESQNQVY